MKPLRELAGGLALLFATLALIGALAWYRLDAYRSGLSHAEGIQTPAFGKLRFPSLSPEDAVQLGWAHLEDRRPESSYTKFADAKAAGVFRIGVFGCSFVYGSETPAGGDFPTLLQRLIDEHGVEGVEVINFGVGGYGIHQAYTMFQRVGSRYALDVAIFNFYAFHRDRDNTFLTNQNSFGPVHARYIERDGIPVQIDVMGADRSEAAAIYHSAIPRWRYLRYDAHPPAILQALVPRGRTLGANPFYALSTDSRDADRVYAAIIDQASGVVPHLIAACNDEESCTFSDLISNRSARVIDMAAPRRSLAFPSLYRAPEAHMTVLGNELIARELFAYLTGAFKARVPTLVHGLPVPFDNDARAPQPFELAGAEIAIGDQRVAVVVERDADGAQYAFEPADLSGRGIRALLDLQADSQFRFAPLDALPDAGTPVEIAFRLGNREVRAIIGRVERSAAGLVRIRGSEFDGEGWRIERPFVSRTGVTSIRAAQPVRDVEIRIGGRSVLRGTTPVRGAQNLQDLRLEPTSGPSLWVRGMTDRATMLAGYPNTGTLDLLLTTEDGREFRQPMIYYGKMLHTLRTFAPGTSSRGSAPLLAHMRARARD